MALVNVVKPTAGSITASLLGSLVFARVGELKIHKNDLESIFINAGLSSKKYDVGQIRCADAMRRATSKIKNMKVTINYNGQMRLAYLDISESNLGKEVLRYVGRKIVDDKGKKVCYDQVTTMIYDKKLFTLSHLPVDPAFQVEYDYEGLLLATEGTYWDWTQHHTQETIRNIVNKVIGSLNPTKIKVSGDDDAIARFVPGKYNTELQALKSVLKNLQPYHSLGDHSGMQFIELFDSDANREMLVQSVTNDISSKVNTLVTDLSSILITKQAISATTVVSLVEKLNQMKSEAAEYSILLKTSMIVLEQQIATAFGRLEEAPIIEETEGEKDGVSI